MAAAPNLPITSFALGIRNPTRDRIELLGGGLEVWEGPGSRWAGTISWGVGAGSAADRALAGGGVLRGVRSRRRELLEFLAWASAQPGGVAEIDLPLPGPWRWPDAPDPPHTVASVSTAGGVRIGVAGTPFTAPVRSLLSSGSAGAFRLHQVAANVRAEGAGLDYRLVGGGAPAAGDALQFARPIATVLVDPGSPPDVDGSPTIRHVCAWRAAL